MTTKDALPVPTPEEKEKNKKYWNAFKPNPGTEAASATPSDTRAAGTSGETKKNKDIDPEVPEKNDKDDMDTAEGEVEPLGSLAALGLSSDIAITIGYLMVMGLVQKLFSFFLNI